MFIIIALHVSVMYWVDDNICEEDEMSKNERNGTILGFMPT